MKSDTRDAIERALIRHDIHYSAPGAHRSTWIVHSSLGKMEMNTPQITAYCLGLADKDKDSSK